MKNLRFQHFLSITCNRETKYIIEVYLQYNYILCNIISVSSRNTKLYGTV